MGIFSNKSSIPLSQWMLFGITKLNETKFATIRQFDEKNELDNETKNHIDSNISVAKTIFFFLNVSKLGLEGKLKIDADTIGRTSSQVLYHYFTQQGLSENEAKKKTEDMTNMEINYFEDIQNNITKQSDFSFCVCKKYAENVYPIRTNVQDMKFTIDEGYKNVVIMKYAKFVFEAIETSLLNSLKNFKVVQG